MKVIKQSVLALAVAASMLTLTACEKRQITHERKLVMQVVAVDLRSKSNSRVDLLDIKTGYVYRGERLSCGKESAKKVKIGSKWDVTQIFYEYPESKRYGDELVGVQGVCYGSK